jgi:peptidoglycan hydrolase CwlO-like protein
MHPQKGGSPIEAGPSAVIGWAIFPVLSACSAGRVSRNVRVYGNLNPARKPSHVAARSWYRAGRSTPTRARRAESVMDVPHPTSPSRRAWRAATAGLLCTAAAAGAVFATDATGVSTQQVDAQRAQVRAVEAELVAVETRASAAASDYADAKAQFEQLQGEVRLNEGRLRVQNIVLERAKTRLAERLVRLYTTPEPSFIEVLASAGSLTGAVDSIDLLKRVQRQDRSVLISVKDSRDRLRSLHRTLVADRAEASDTSRRAANQLVSLRTLAGQRQAILGQARASLSALESQQAAQAQIAAVARAQVQAQRATSPTSSPEDLTAGLPQTTDPTSASPAAPPSSGAGTSNLSSIAQCESGGNPAAVSPGGTYRGKYQFLPETWQAVGGNGDPAQASEAEQDLRAGILYDRVGASAWPVCGAH